MADILGCFNCKFFNAVGDRPKSHAPGTLYRGSCGNALRPGAFGEMKIRMTQERVEAEDNCAWHSSRPTLHAADETPAWLCDCGYKHLKPYEGFVCSCGAAFRR